MEADRPSISGGLRERFAPRASRLAEHLEQPGTSRRIMTVAWPLGVALIVGVGLQQWFIRDDWAFLLTRGRIGRSQGFVEMVMHPQDGHWMIWPILVFRALNAVFGAGSYLPYLVVLWACHIGVVLLSRMWMRRFGVSTLTTTLSSIVLLVFGAGWENLFFAVQIVYLFSMLAFLGQALLADHDGPVDARDWIGSAVGVFGVSSSGFGPFFAFGIGMLLALRRRWRAAAIAVIPQGVALSWWWLTYGDDRAGDAGTAGLRFVIEFVRTGVTSALGALVGTGYLSWSAVLLVLAVIAWGPTGRQRRVPMVAMAATVLAMYVGIGARREIFGVGAAGWSRYVYMSAILLAPTLAFGIDQARRFAPAARWLAHGLLVFAVVRNVVWMVDHGGAWADRADEDRRLFGLVAGNELPPTVRVDRFVSLQSPDVVVLDLADLVEQGAITPRQAATADDRRALDAALATNAAAP